VRILLTTHAFLPRSVAGVEVYTARLAAALEELGHAVLVLTATHDLDAPPHSVRRRGFGPIDVVEIVNNHLEGTLEATYRAPAIDRAIEGVLDEFRPDCVHAQHLLNLSTGLLEVARVRGVPVVLTLHDYWLSCPRDGLRMRADGMLCGSVDHRVCAPCLAGSPHLVPPLQRGASGAARRLGLGRALHLAHGRAPRATATLLAALRRAWPVGSRGIEGALDERDGHLRRRLHDAHVILAPTRFARDRAVEWGAPADRTRVLPLGAVAGPTRPRRAAARRRFGYVGTLAPHKGVHVLLEAVKGLPRHDFTLDVVGNPSVDPGYAARLRALAGGDPRVRFRGAVPPADQERLWESLDLLVLPSLWWENSPLTVLEALAAGRPVVASRTGGVPEILPPSAGLLVAPGDVEELRAALVGVLEDRLLAAALDPLPLKTCRQGAIELAELYSEARRR
jgi:glycosyltransferase involved in cell wall biosynthesis